jgi:pyrroline-5-carboxylate reductase
MKLTIIGSGAMAMALADGLHSHYKIEFIARDEKRLKEISQIFNASYSILGDNDITDKNIILCVKPNAIGDVSQELVGSARVVYSILAGTTIKEIKSNISARHTIRAMPNVAAAFGESATTLTGDIILKDEAMDIFAKVGDSIWLNSEKEIDIATAIAGSGPAYLSLVAEAMMDGGVKQGLKRADSMRLVQVLFGGFAPLIASNHPALIKDSVMSPAGTTASGYASLEEGGVRDSFIKAVESAFKVTQK